MSASIHYLPPGHGAARRAMQDPKTPPAIRAVCADMLNEAPVETRKLTLDELSEVIVPRPAQFRCDPVGLGDDEQRGGVIVVMCLALFFTFSLAMYGAVRLGGDVVRMALGVQPQIQTERISK
jgi:hypothetical protein